MQCKPLRRGSRDVCGGAATVSLESLNALTEADAGESAKTMIDNDNNDNTGNL